MARATRRRADSGTCAGMGAAPALNRIAAGAEGVKATLSSLEGPLPDALRHAARRGARKGATPR